MKTECFTLLSVIVLFFPGSKRLGGGKPHASKGIPENACMCGHSRQDGVWMPKGY
jgi:hypothetical protein